jgi:hypothetical protein
MEKTIVQTQKLASSQRKSQRTSAETATILTKNQKKRLSEATTQTVAILHNSEQFSAIPHNS